MRSPSRFKDASPWLILSAGLALRLAIAPLGAHPGDFATLTGWAQAIAHHGLLNIYQTSDANYPPLALALLGGSRWLYGLVTPGDPVGPLWMILLKLPAILADIGMGALVWRKTARRGMPSGWLLAAIIFNPALIYLSAWWGQIDSVVMLPALAALLDMLDDHVFRAGLWLGIGVMVKLQAAVVAPLIVFLLLVRSGPDLPPPARIARWMAGLTLPLAVCLGPFAATGQIDRVLARLVALISGPGWLTVNALNFWYLVTLGAGNWGYNKPLTLPDSAPVIAGVSAHTVGLILLGLWCAAVFAGVSLAYRREERGQNRFILHTAALLYLGVFLWPTQVHERYAFGAVVMLAGAAAFDRAAAETRPSSLYLYLTISALHTLNLIWAAPFVPSLGGWFAGNVAVGIAIAAGLLGAAMWDAPTLSRSHPH
jgi:hypothetical protein